MEFFIPGLFLFLVAILLTFIIAPRATPLIAAILSIVFLTFGVYEHHKMFAAEYRLSTWQDGLKIYAPAIMIGMIIIFIIYSILAFFTKGTIPVPSIPNISAPNENTVTNTIVNSLNSIANTLTNTKNNLVGTVNNTINKVNENRTSLINTLVGNNNNNRGTNNKKNGNNLSRSFLETL
jgi:hypothetical protein